MRGEIWSVAASGYASKPRPAVVVQNDTTDSFESTIVCLFTTDKSIAGPTRVPIQPDETNGLAKGCIVMADKVITLKKSSLHTKIGELSSADMVKVETALKITLGL